jgi:hypothetical protein
MDSDHIDYRDDSIPSIQQRLYFNQSQQEANAQRLAQERPRAAPMGVAAPDARKGRFVFGAFVLVITYFLFLSSKVPSGASFVVGALVIVVAVLFAMERLPRVLILLLRVVVWLILLAAVLFAIYTVTAPLRG